MLSGLDFLKIVFGPSYKFDPFGDEENLVNFGLTPPPAAKPEVRLHHPRPVHRPALIAALAHFEEVAPFWNEIHRVSNHVTSPLPISALATGSKIPVAKPRHASPDALPANDQSRLPAALRVVGAPLPKPVAAPLPLAKPASSGLACLSPGFLDHFPALGSSAWPRAPSASELPKPTFNHFKARIPGARCFFPPPAKPQTQNLPIPAPASPGLACLSPGFLDHFDRPGDAWPRAPRAEDLPKPTFNHFSRRAPVPATSTILTLPSQYTFDNAHDEVEDDALTDFSDLEDRVAFSFEEEDERGSNGSDSSNEGNEVIKEAYYTASEYADDSDWEVESVYDSDGADADDEASVCSRVARHMHNTITLSSSACTVSPADSLSSTSTAVSHYQSTLTATNSAAGVPKGGRPMQLHQTVGMHGNSLTFLATERALQLQVQAEAHKRNIAVNPTSDPPPPPTCRGLEDCRAE